MSTIGNINIDFNTSSNSPLHLFVMDLSDWVYAEDLPSYITIKLPGSNKEKTFSFKKYKTNIFNSHNLGLSCFTGNCQDETYVDLPDGIYTICVKSSFENIENSHYYLKTDRFDIEYNKVLIKYGTDSVDDNFIKLMIKIKYTLDVAKANIMNGDFVKGIRYFQESKKLLKRFVDCKDCL